MGMSTFYSDFGFKGGEVLVFEYYGQSDMNVYVLGLHSCEIDYPMIIHLSQCGNPLKSKALYFLSKAKGIFFSGN